LDLAEKNKIEILAITDHDTFAGYEEAREMAADYQIELLPGIEISTTYKDTDVHILAYFVDVNNQVLNQELEKIQQGRYRRAEKIVKKLAEFGINLSLEKIIKLAGKNDLIGRPHIARAMVEAGFVANKNEAFDIYLADGGKAYYPKPSPDPARIIQLIKAAGGVSVLAHPQTLGDDALIYDIIAMGIDGLEVFYAKSSYETTMHLDGMALKNGLIRTGGTDFHGDSFDEEIFQVFEAPESVVAELKAKYKQRSKGE
jgi:predicted metal-dependent phosphoesterase TrpH